MEKLLKSTKRKNRIKKIIFSSAMVITMAVFFISGFSAASDNYYQYNFTDAQRYSILSQFDPNNTYYSVSGSGNGSYLSKTTNVSVNDTFTLPVQNSMSLVFNDYFFYSPFAIIPSSTYRDLYFRISFPFVYTIKGGDTFTIYMYGNPDNYSNTNLWFIDTDGQAVTCTYTARSIAYNSSFDAFYNEYEGYIYYYNVNTSSFSSISYLSKNVIFALDITIDGSSYYDVSSFVINLGYIHTQTNNLRVFFRFSSLPPYYFNDIENINNTLNIVNQKLDIITGPVSSDAQATLDDLNDDFEQKQAQLQDDLDIIHSVEFPTDVPTNFIPHNDFQYITDNIAPIFSNLSSLQIFNVIVPTGCVGFLIYICLRRF